MRVVILAVSEPASGSVTQIAPISRPSTMPGR